MKVLLVNKFHYIKSGSERVYFDTKKVLEEKGHEVVCFSMQDERNLPSDQSEFFVPNVDFSNTKGWFKKSLRFLYYPEAARRLEKLIEQEKPDIAHLHNIYHQLTYSILKPLRKHKIPVVHTLHDYQVIAPNYHLYSHGSIDEICKKRKYYRCVFRKCVRASFLPSLLATLEAYLNWFMGFAKKVDLYISPSNFLITKFREWGFKPEMKVINNFVHCDEFVPEYTPGDYLLYFGRISKEKGIMTLIRAVKKLPDVKLKIVGLGPQKEMIESYLKKKQIKNVEVLGPRYSDDLFNIVKKARMIVSPSRWFENYPMSILEAMALGKPILASDIGGQTEMVTKGYNGWLVKPSSIVELREQIRKVYNDVHLIEQYGRNARRTIEQKNCAEVYARQIIETYNQVLGKKNLDLG
jgi:glycosyltransferase involved in cell wall biosynthesis